MCKIGERHFREPQDIEFTIEQGKILFVTNKNCQDECGCIGKNISRYGKREINQ